MQYIQESFSRYEIIYRLHIPWAPLNMNSIWGLCVTFSCLAQISFLPLWGCSECNFLRYVNMYKSSSQWQIIFFNHRHWEVWRLLFPQSGLQNSRGLHRKENHHGWHWELRGGYCCGTWSSGKIVLLVIVNFTRGTMCICRYHPKCKFGLRRTRKKM